MTMNLNFRRICGTASAAAVLMGTGVLAVAAPASAQSARPWPGSVATAQIATVFDLNGIFTDGGSARPRITNVSNVLTVDMSSQNRPTAVGLVLSTNQIVVTFPDVNWSFHGTLVPPGRIVWDNNTDWVKLPYVPSVINMPATRAGQVLQAAGFTAKTVLGHRCGNAPPLVVSEQDPKAEAQAEAGSQVVITMSNC
jgi:hypothetical protein